MKLAKKFNYRSLSHNTVIKTAEKSDVEGDCYLVTWPVCTEDGTYIQSGCVYVSSENAYNNICSGEWIVTYVYPEVPEKLTKLPKKFTWKYAGSNFIFGITLDTKSGLYALSNGEFGNTSEPYYGTGYILDAINTGSWEIVETFDDEAVEVATEVLQEFEDDIKEVEILAYSLIERTQVFCKTTSSDVLVKSDGTFTILGKDDDVYEDIEKDDLEDVMNALEVLSAYR